MDPTYQEESKRMLRVVVIVVFMLLLTLGGGVTYIFTKPASSKTKDLKAVGSKAYIVSDIYASDGKALELYGNAKSSKNTVTPDVNYISVTAKGDQCNGAPDLEVLIDDATVLKATVANTSYMQYKAHLNGVLAGSHKVEIKYANDYYLAGNCDRNLIIDKVEFWPAAGGNSVPAGTDSTASPSPTPSSTSSGSTNKTVSTSTTKKSTSTPAPTPTPTPAAGGGSAGDGTVGTVIKNLDFQTGDLSQWTEVQRVATNRYQVVPAPAPLASKYKYAARVEIDGGDALIATGQRSEALWGGDSNPTLKSGDNYYFGWSTMFDANFPSPGTSSSTSPYGHSLFIQWKNTGTGSPPIDLEAILNRHQVGYSGKCNGWNIPLVRGGRTDWVVHVYFSSDSTKGLFEIWERAPGEASLSKKLTCHLPTLNSGTSSYLKLGNYRKDDETKTGILYHAGMKVGTGFAAVDPTK
ncbi:MAG: heparin lyase I family protein [Candidatus Saccharimonadales bacterium]